MILLFFFNKKILKFQFHLKATPNIKNNKKKNLSYCYDQMLSGL